MPKSLNNRQFFILALGSAVVLRLCLMPFFTHTDLFSEARRIFYVIEHGYLFDQGHRLVVYYIEMLFTAFSMLFIDVSDGLFQLTDPTQSTSDTVDYGFFLQDPNIYKHLFFFKLPYLLFDVATAVVIWRFIDDPKYKKLALLIWLFNPITLFATYIFGRFEVISLFFLAMTALQLKYHRVFLASFMFALSLHCREINLLFAPFFLLAVIDFKDHPFKNLSCLVLCTAIIGVTFIAPAWLIKISGGDLMLFVDPNATAGSDAFEKMLSLGYYWFYPIIIALSALAIYAWEIGDRPHHERFVITAALAICIYFGFNVHSVHYTAWFVLFPVMALQFNKNLVVPFLALFGVWLIMWLLKTDYGVFTLSLAAPLSTELIDTGHFPTFFQRHIATETFTLYQAIQIVRSLFLVVMGFFAYRLLKNNSQKTPY